jgi:hypothetical protein
MVLTGAQTTQFFESNDQMGIPNATTIQLQNEGISTVDDLNDFDKDTLQQVADNLRRPGGRVPDPTPGAAAGATIPTPPFVFGAKSQKRLLAACDIVRYYEETGRPLTAANIQWNTVIKNFGEQWKALKDRKTGDLPEVPKITKALPVIKWTQAFADYLHRVIGVRMIPLAYVIREDVAVPAAAPVLLAGQPHSAEHGSVEAELVARAQHNHALYRDDNANVYYKLEEATRTTAYAASIKPFQRTKNGRGAFQALTNQYAGQDKWEAELKKQDDLLHTREWKGQSNYTLERFVQQHRTAYVSMQSCAEYVEYQLPTEHTRVGYLLDGIQCNDAGLQAAMASIKLDTTPITGKRNDFELAATHLLPYDPVAKKRTGNHKRGAGDISDATGADISSFGAKEGIGKTGVHLRYHKDDEYADLNREQMDELREWRLTPEGKKQSNKRNKGSKGGHKKGGGDRKRQKREKVMAASVNKQVEKRLAELQKNAATVSFEEPSHDEARAYIMSLLEEKKPTVSATNVRNVTHDLAKVTLKSIMAKSKNQK